MKRALAARQEADAADPPPPPTFGDVRAVAKELSAAIDDVASKLAVAEKQLSGIGLGIDTSVDMTSEEDQRDGRFTRLAFMKGSHWGLFVLSGRDDDRDEDFEVVPLLSASKTLRNRAADVVADLLEAMIVAGRKQIADARRASRTLDYLLAGAISDVTTAEDPFEDDVPF